MESLKDRAETHEPKQKHIASSDAHLDLHSRRSIRTNDHRMASMVLVKINLFFWSEALFLKLIGLALKDLRRRNRTINAARFDTDHEVTVVLQKEFSIKTEDSCLIWLRNI
jgi:hypothetical protein